MQFRLWLSVLNFLMLATPLFVQAQSESAARAPASYRNQDVKELKKLTEPTTEAPAPQEAAEGSQLTGSWNGRRSSLSDQGLDFALIYKGEFNQTLSGGLRRRGVYLENVDIRAALDFDKAFGWKGASAFVYGLGNMGGDRDSSPSTDVGDAQASSNIETGSDSFKLYQFWLQQTFIEDRVSLLFGLHDLNSEFYVTETSALFFNSSFGIGKDISQTGVNGPSIFPTTSVAVRLQGKLTENISGQVGFFDAQSGDPTERHHTHIRYSAEDGVLAIAELSLERGSEESGNKSKYTIGFWQYSKEVDHLMETNTDSFGANLPTQAKNQGAYILADQHLSDSVSVFARYGVASRSVNRFELCASAGAVWTGLIPTRSKDRFGIGATMVRNGADYRESKRRVGVDVHDSEIAYELNYRFELSPGVALQPDYQYIVQPNTDSAVSDASVGALRVEISF